MGYPKNLVFQYPNGKWGFVGRVDCRLTWQNKDGSPLTSDDVATLVSASNPGMLFTSKVYATRELAIEAAKALSVEYNEG